MTPSPAVLEHFAPHTRGLIWHRVQGGFSGADVWRGDEDRSPRVALKAWPPGIPLDRVRSIHAWLARAAHLPFIPTVFPGMGKRTILFEADRLWDCCRWMPGAPRTNPSSPDVVTACEAIGRLHAVWSEYTIGARCPGVVNRLRILAEHEPLLRAGPDALPALSPLLDPLLRRAVVGAARVAPGAVRALRPWENRIIDLHPCVRDLRGEHVLFEDDRVGGIIDFGAMAVDHPAVDLARLLGDYAWADETRFASGLNAYRGVRGQFYASTEFVRLLAETGIVCSVLGWLARLLARGPVPADPIAVAARLQSLVARMDDLAIS